MTDAAPPTWDTWILPFDYERARAQGYDGTEAEAYLLLGQHLQWRGHPEDALFALERSLELDGENGQAWYYLAEFLARRGLWERAVQAFQHSLRVSPEHWVTALKLGRALRAAGRHAEAIEALSQSHEWNPKSISPLVDRAECRVILGEIDLAVRDLQAALEIDPAAKRLRARLAQLTGEVKPGGRTTP